MNWKRWKIGLLVAACTGGATAFCMSGLVAMTWRELFFVFAGSVAKDVLLFLHEHPVQTVEEETSTKESK